MSEASLLEQMVDNAPIGVALVGLDGKFTRANRALCEMLGYEEHELLELLFHEITLPDDLQAQLRLVGQLLRGEVRNLQVQERCRHKQGGELWVRLSMSLARDEAGRPACFFAQIDDITESIKQAGELERSRGSLQGLIDYAPVSISLRDLEGRYQVVNPHVCRATGKEPEDLLGRHPADCYPPEAALELTRGDADVIRTGEAITHERQLPDSDGTDHTYFAVKYPVRDSDGKVIGIGACGIDITARKVAEERVRMRERELAEAQQLAHVGSWDLDLASGTVRMTDELCRILGREPGFEPSTREVLALVHPEDRAAVRDQLGKARPDQSEELRCRILRPNGEVGHLHTRYHGRAGMDGRLAHLWGTAQDVTETVTRELELQHAREHSETILRVMGEGYCLTTEGQIIAVNEAMTRLTGFTTEELIGARVPYPFWPPEEVDEATALRRSVHETGGGTFEQRLLRKDGTRFAAELTTTEAHRPDGSLLGYVNTIRDISDHKRYEEELKRLATYDALTGLPNHGLFHETLTREFAQAIRHKRPLSLAVLDLDRFKSVNDSYGHPVGDTVLARVGTVMSALVREGELVGRVGGEEFAWLLPDTVADEAMVAVERLRRAISEEEISDIGAVTVSIGVCDLSEAATPAELYKRADEALYWAKRGGRNRAILYSAAAARRFAAESSVGE